MENAMSAGNLPAVRFLLNHGAGLNLAAMKVTCQYFILEFHLLYVFDTTDNSNLHVFFVVNYL